MQLWSSESLSGICFSYIGMENSTIKKACFERLEESAGLELDKSSLLIHKSTFWHHLNDEINNIRQETIHDEDRILGASPPSNGLCIMRLNKLFYNTRVVCASMHFDMKASSTYLHPLCRGRKKPCSRPQSQSQPSPQPQSCVLLSVNFV